MHRSIPLALATCFTLATFIILSPSRALAAPSHALKPRTVQQHQIANQHQWQVIASPSLGNIGSFLNAEAAVAASDIWAVGESYSPTYLTQTLVEDWNGSAWRVVASPNDGTDINQLNGVAAVATNNVWAVGYYRNGHLRTLIEHWDGTQWSIIASPNVGNSDNQLEAITALSANNIWAVGTYANTNLSSNLTLIEHWNGTKWSVVTSPNTQMTINNLTGIARVSATNIWAVGYTEDGTYQTLVEHWNGSQWSMVASPKVTNSNSLLNSVSILTANNIWAGGFYYDLNLHRDFTLIEHWNGSAWSIVPSPNVGTDFCLLYGIAAMSANVIWAVGTDEHIPPHYTLTEQWNGTQWNIITSPNPSTTYNSLQALLTVSGNLWAVGTSFNTQTGAYDTLVEFYGG